MPCSSRDCYVGQTGCTILDRGKQRLRCISRLGHRDKSALADHSVKLNHEVLFSSIKNVTQVYFFCGHAN